MKFNDATEAAYKNGYADGVKAIEEKLMLEVRDLRIELKAERAIAKVYKEGAERYKCVIRILEDDVRRERKKDTEIDILIRKKETLQDELAEKQAEIERLKEFEEKIAEYHSSIRVEDMLVFASSLEEWLEFCDNLKAEAYKEFAERLCEGRVSNDPVVIAAKVELTEMESERE